jgi:cGMP-dependent 3',5'-cyclic phosphodiesterase
MLISLAATDLAQHLRVIGQHKSLVTDGYNKSNETHHLLLLSLIMTCCDLSDQTKKWTVTKKIAVNVYYVSVA